MGEEVGALRGQLGLDLLDRGERLALRVGERAERAARDQGAQDRAGREEDLQRRTARLAVLPLHDPVELALAGVGPDLEPRDAAHDLLALPADLRRPAGDERALGCGELALPVDPQAPPGRLCAGLRLGLRL